MSKSKSRLFLSNGLPHTRGMATSSNSELFLSATNTASSTEKEVGPARREVIIHSITPYRWSEVCVTEDWHSGRWDWNCADNSF